MKRMSSRVDNGNNLNLKKVFLFLIVLVLIMICFLLIYFNFIKKRNNDIDSTIISEVSEQNDEKAKTIEDIVSEFGGEISKQIKNDTYYITKDGKNYTAYLDGDIIEGDVQFWDGTAIEPAIDEAGNYNIYRPEELKWIADRVINGEKNFSGVTITLRNNLDFGARCNENGEWEGNSWTSIIGFLDEINLENNENQNESNNNNENNLASNQGENDNQENENIDTNTEITKENLKRFAGILNGNDLWIRGLYVNSEKRYQGLFGYQTGTIQNLTIKNSSIQGGEGTGGFAGLNGGTIVNCHIENVMISGLKQDKIGGIAGISMIGSWIENCSTLESKIYGENYVGGITGYMNNNSAIINSSNSSLVMGTDYLGGIAGITFFGTQIKNSSNIDSNIEGINYVGGLVGYSQSNIENSSSQNKENGTGKVSGYNCVGGLVGLNYSMGNISNSFNSSEINCFSISEVKNIGGIVGQNNATISNCYNKGKIIIENNIVEKIGGICGQNSSQSYIYNSYNIGKIDCKIASGCVDANFGEISNCFYLNSCILNENNAEYSRDENQMKNEIIESLGVEFKEDTENKNDGYPILSWQ